MSTWMPCTKPCQHGIDGRQGARCEAALLGGILICDTCGRRLRPNYSNPNKPYYLCASHVEEARERECCGLSAGVIDHLVVSQLFKALEPAALELSVRVVDDERQERARRHQPWEQQLELARYLPLPFVEAGEAFEWQWQQGGTLRLKEQLHLPLRGAVNRRSQKKSSSCKSPGSWLCFTRWRCGRRCDMETRSEIAGRHPQSRFSSEPT